MAARRGPHVISLHDPNNPPLLGHAPGAPAGATPPAAAPAARDGEAAAPSPADRLALARHRSSHPAVAAIEERLAARDEDIQDLLIDNQRFAATHVALQQQLVAAQHELRAVSVAAARARAEREAEVAALADQAAHIEAEARAVAAAREEVDRVHADVQVFATARGELLSRLQGLREQLALAQADAGRRNDVRAQIENMRQEIRKGRAAVDFEKKAHADNLELSKAMEKNMIAVASEIEKLRGDLANAEKGVPAVANPGYAATYGTEATYPATYGNPEATYGVHSYADAYSTNQAQMHTDGNSYYMSQPAPHPQY